MRVIVAVECDVCPDRIEVVKDSWGLKIPLNSEIRNEARRQGWHIGRRCICPECQKLAENCGACSTCQNWRNKSMERPTCELDGELALAKDWCDSYDGGEGT